MRPIKFFHRLYDNFEKRWLIGNKALQAFFERLYRFSLRGMNFGQVQSLSLSGEVFVLNELKRRHRDVRTILDVGANIGHYALVASSIFPDAQIYSVEASPDTFKMLSDNTADSQNIQAFNFALGGKEEVRDFFSDKPGSALASFHPTGAFDTNVERHPILVTSLDAFCRTHGIESIDFLKIDVEGFELEVLKGASGLLSTRKIKFIQFEFGGNAVQSGIHMKNFFTQLSAYSISRVLRNGLRPLNNYDEMYEIYSAANYLAELRK